MEWLLPTGRSGQQSDLKSALSDLLHFLCCHWESQHGGWSLLLYTHVVVYEHVHAVHVYGYMYETHSENSDHGCKGTQ